jgi:hypothetical protein
MAATYPQDDDGDALRRLQASGNDMSRPMDIDFTVAVDDEAAGRRVAESAAARGFRVEVEQDDEEGCWTVYCTKEMLATHEGVTAAQNELNALSRPHGGSCDGWGTFGNA